MNDKLAISSLNSQIRGILRYEALQEIRRNILIDSPSFKVEVRSLELQDPTIKALVERIKCAKLSWQKKENLLRLIFMYLRGGQGNSVSPKGQEDFVKEMYALIQTMELTEKYRLSPEELDEHKKKVDELVTNFLVEEERARQLKELQEKAAYDSGAHPIVPPSEGVAHEPSIQNTSSADYAF